MNIFKQWYINYQTHKLCQQTLRCRVDEVLATNLEHSLGKYSWGNLTIRALAKNSLAIQKAIATFKNHMRVQVTAHHLQQNDRPTEKYCLQVLHDCIQHTETVGLAYGSLIHLFPFAKDGDFVPSGLFSCFKVKLAETKLPVAFRSSNAAKRISLVQDIATEPGRLTAPDISQQSPLWLDFLKRVTHEFMNRHFIDGISNPSDEDFAKTGCVICTKRCDFTQHEAGVLYHTFLHNGEPNITALKNPKNKASVALMISWVYQNAQAFKTKKIAEWRAVARTEVSQDPSKTMTRIHDRLDEAERKKQFDDLYPDADFNENLRFAVLTFNS